MQSSFINYLLGIGSNLCFGTASIAFSRFSVSHSPAWINQLKVCVAFVCFLAAFCLVETWVPLKMGGHAYLLLSGFLGLCIGDLFLFKAMAELGAARTLVLYSFQPFLLALYGYLFLNQRLTNQQALAIFCMIGCVATFVIERNRTHGHFAVKAFSMAFLGIFFEGVSMMLTRQVYEEAHALGSFEANTLRSIGALIGFLLISPRSYVELFRYVKTMPPGERGLAVGASFIGTFVCLSLYLQALKTAHVASLTAISITLPVWVSLIEHVQQKKWPNRYLQFAFVLFVVGFVLMNVR